MSSSATFVEGGSLRVLTIVRDRIHLGWSLLTHPLYGNIQPFRQPFRSILVGLSDD
ncbi:MAG: GrdX family protein, partial [Thermovirgaceae bacterium]|nr:GrdX family protein [Thermovirgaceae bacterium]